MPPPYARSTGGSGRRGCKASRSIICRPHVKIAMSAAGCGFIFQIIAGLMLAVQMNVRFSALGLAVFTLRASLMLLDFW